MLTVYYYSRPIDGAAISWLRYLDRRARHTGVILEETTSGFFYSIEISPNKYKKNKIQFEQFNKFTQRHSINSKWLYKVGETNMSLDAIKAYAEKLAQKHHYSFYSENRRAFTDDLLRKTILKEGTLISEDHLIKVHHFKKSPCEAVEHKIHKRGSNVPKHVYAQSASSSEMLDCQLLDKIDSHDDSTQQKRTTFDSETDTGDLTFWWFFFFR